MAVFEIFDFAVCFILFFLESLLNTTQDRAVKKHETAAAKTLRELCLARCFLPNSSEVQFNFKQYLKVTLLTHGHIV